MFFRRAVLMFALVAFTMPVAVAYGQQCRRQCSDGERRDARGCCIPTTDKPAPAPQQPQRPQPRRPQPRRPQPQGPQPQGPQPSEPQPPASTEESQPEQPGASEPSGRTEPAAPAPGAAAVLDERPGDTPSVESSGDALPAAQETRHVHPAVTPEPIEDGSDPQPRAPVPDEGTRAVDPGKSAATKQPAAPPPASIMPAGPEPRASDKRLRRYGGTMALVDASVLLVGGIVTATTDGGVGPAIIFGGYGLSGAITHAFHGNPGTALQSFLNRAGLSVGGALAGLVIGVTVCDDSDASSNALSCAAGATLGGAALGAAGALALDWFVLAQDLVEIPAADISGTVVSPHVSLGRQYVGVGLQGVF
jgi:hypothetical protein